MVALEAGGGPEDPQASGPGNGGVAALVLLLRFCEVAVTPEQLLHQFGKADIGMPDMLRVAKQLKLKARAVTCDWEALAKMPLPGIAQCADGGFLVLARHTGDRVIVQDARVGRPELLTREEFTARWNGRLVLIARRASLSDLARRFDLTWFLQAMHKYRRLLGEVMLASFMLQLFALATPLFFQVVTDKVLTHRGFTTLDVLVVGLIAVSIFELVLGTLRTYVFAHTTNRIDVELGARLFRHLMALPIAYFEAPRRRLGCARARARDHP
jgi:ATP-binding cassette, subfamily B, bacterial HlyB/CyaB